jgi:molybdopterin converting factor small subunit
VNTAGNGKMGVRMSVKVNIHPVLRHMTDGQSVVEVKGSTVGQCLKQLVTQFPKIESAIFNKDGRLLSYVEIYVNHESSYPEELKKKVEAGDEIHIVLMLTGG